MCLGLEEFVKIQALGSLKTRWRDGTMAKENNQDLR